MKFVVAFDRAVSAVAAPFNTHTPLTLCLSPPPRTHPSSEWLKLRLQQQQQKRRRQQQQPPPNPTLTVMTGISCVFHARIFIHSLSFFRSLWFLYLLFVVCLWQVATFSFLFAPFIPLFSSMSLFLIAFLCPVLFPAVVLPQEWGRKKDTLLSSVMLLSELSKWHIRLLFCCYRTNSVSLQLCYR